MIIRKIDFVTAATIWKKHLWPNRIDNIKPTNNIKYMGGRDSRIHKQDVVFFAAFHDDKIVGINSGFSTLHGGFRSRGLWTDPEHRLKGIGKALLLKTIEHAKTQNNDYIWSMPRESALHVYTSVGFKQTSEFFDKGIEFGPNCFVRLDLKNNSFCPLPFIHLSTLPTGQTRLCCKTVNCHIPNGNLNDTTIQDIWNNEYYRTVRQQMLVGEYPKDCKVCYNEDAVGKRSMRIKELEIWENSSTLKKALDSENNGYLETDPVYLDLRMGNLCNLKCRTCDPVSSSQIQKEVAMLDSSPLFFRQKIIDAEQMKPWWKNTLFKKSIESLLSSAELIWLSGGEPTLVPEGNALIQQCIDAGIAKDIVLRLVVNLTNVTDQFIERYEQFKQANFHCSLDAIGDANHYLRYPSNFAELEKNLRKIVNSKSNLVCLICTISLMNIYRLPDLINWLDNFNKTSPNRVRLNINPLNEPEIFHPRILDDDTKHMITERLTSYRTNDKNTRELRSLLNMMNTESNNSVSLRRDFRQYIDSVDNVRKQCFVEVFPELEKFYKQCNG